MEILEGLLLVNDKDVYKEYGAYLSEEKEDSHDNYSALFKPARSKKHTGVSLTERNGVKYPDKMVIGLDERDVELRFSIEASDANDFLAKYSGFITMLREGENGWLRFYFPEILKTFRFFYDDCPGWEQLTTFDGKVYANFKIRFKEPEPQY